MSNDAFISYSRRDKSFAAQLEKALEAYRPPRELKTLQRHLVVFRDENDFTGVEYHGSLLGHLRASRKLIVLCSPNSRKSEFVNDEIRQFAKLRGAENIIPVLVSGVPNNDATPEQEDDKAFPEALLEHMEMPLAASYSGFSLKKDKLNRGPFAPSWYKLLADLYGISRSEVEQREKKREARRRRIAASVTGSVILVLSVALIFALVSRRQAVERGEIALARQLAAQSELLRIESPNLLDRCGLLAIEAAHRTSGLEVDRSLRKSVGLLPQLVWDFAGEEPVNAVAISNLGDWAAAGGDDGIVRCWDIESGREIARIDHGATVRSVVASADSRYLASASANGVIVRDLESGNDFRIDEQAAAVLAIGGDLLAVGGGEDGRIALWDMVQESLAQTLWLEGAAAALAFSDDQSLLAAGGSGNTVQVWDVGTGDELMRGFHQAASASMPLRLGSRDGGVFAVSFYPSGEFVVSAGQDHAVSVWRIADGAELFRGYQSDSVYGVAISPDGRWLASGGMDETARVWSLEDGSERYRLEHGYVVQKVLWNSDNDLLTVSGDGTARLWSMSDGLELSRAYHPGYIHDAAISGDNSLLITGDWDGIVRIWKLSGGAEALRLPHSSTRSAVYSPDGRYLATTGETDYVQLWALPEGKPTYRFHHQPFASVVAFSPDGKTIATSGWDGVVALWEVASGEQLATMEHEGRVVEAEFSPDGRLLATAGFEDEFAKVWEVPTGRKVYQLQHEGVEEDLRRMFQRGGVRVLDIDPTGDQLATGGQDGTVRLWSLKDGHEVRRFEERGYIQDVKYTPDGQSLVIESKSDIEVRDLKSGERFGNIDKLAANDEFMSVLGMSRDGRMLLVSSFEENSVQVRMMPNLNVMARLLHEDDVFSGAFNGDASAVLTAARDKTARIWSTGTWQETTRVVANDFMYSAQYNPDEKFFVTASGDGFARIWAADLGALAELACQRLHRNLTPEEWRQYFGSRPYSETCPENARQEQ